MYWECTFDYVEELSARGLIGINPLPPETYWKLTPAIRNSHIVGRWRRGVMLFTNSRRGQKKFSPFCNFKKLFAHIFNEYFVKLLCITSTISIIIHTSIIFQQKRYVVVGKRKMWSQFGKFRELRKYVL